MAGDGGARSRHIGASTSQRRTLLMRDSRGQTAIGPPHGRPPQRHGISLLGGRFRLGKMSAGESVLCQATKNSPALGEIHNLLAATRSRVRG
jgi:hypothetical protein